jgi:hypothetical protein
MNFEQQLKAKNVVEGTRAIKRIVLPLVNSPGPLLTDQPELADQRARDGHPERIEVVVGIRALTPIESDEVDVGANEYAAERNVPESMRNGLNPTYSLGFNLHVLARACVDPDSDPKNPVPFFGAPGDITGAIERILKSTHLSRDSIIYLAQHQESWQDQVSPQVTTMSPEKMWELMEEVAASTDLGPFLHLRLGMLQRFTQFLVGQLLISLARNLPSDSSSSDKK